MNYQGGVVVASGTITQSCTGCADELTVRNQGAGTTHIVVDVTGYFAAPVATALACTTETAAVSLAAGVGQSSSATASCLAGYTATGGGAFEGGLDSIRMVKLSISATSVFCRLTNNTASALTAECQARCCRVPGR